MPTAEDQIGADLYAACQSDDVEAVRRINTEPQSPYKIQALLQAAATCGATNVAAYCLQNGAYVGSMVMHHIISSRDSEPVYRLLLESNVIKVDYYVDRTGTMLGAAANGGRHSLARYLLSKGAEVNDTFEAQANISILACAAQWSDAAMVKLLLENGAKIRNSNALALAAQNGKLENICTLLEHGADINEMGVTAPFDPRSARLRAPPLHKAVENHHVEVVKTLMKAGADINAKDAQERTAVERAREVGTDAILQELSKAAQ